MNGTDTRIGGLELFMHDYPSAIGD
jgi:hypothetical protein